MELDKNFKKSEFTNPLESGLPKMVLRTRIPQSRFVSIPGIRILMKLADGDTSHATSLRGIHRGDSGYGLTGYGGYGSDL